MVPFEPASSKTSIDALSVFAMVLSLVVTPTRSTPLSCETRARSRRSGGLGLLVVVVVPLAPRTTPPPGDTVGSDS